MTAQYDLIKAAQLISHADGLIITAGAGLGVDSGLPDFRGRDGFWRSYPALKASGIDFISIASPEHFLGAPRLAWGFYGHRLALYRQTQPHAGFGILRRIADRMAQGAFVYTSNVDGQFQEAGFLPEHIHECHGSIHFLQCQHDCRGHVWSAESFSPEVDRDTGLLMNAPPVCPYCGGTARPNILMFNDWGWVSARYDEQRRRFYGWRTRAQAPVVIELGAGTSISTVRDFGERQWVPMVRVNPRESQIERSAQHVSLAMGALEALDGIQTALIEIGFLQASV